MLANIQKLRRFRPWGILVLILCMSSFLLFLKPTAHPTHALASTDPITVKTQTSKVTFPKNI
ncbi:MAG TPA: hypothetical protein VHZ51_18240, partial [Ktedonobacteraceae bacterium]|nr:hypothetical protein [Ktedonobacteraceae bacterium]